MSLHKYNRIIKSLKGVECRFLTGSVVLVKKYSFSFGKFTDIIELWILVYF